MLQPISHLFNEKKFVWDKTDTRHFVQAWLRERLKTEELYCEQVAGGQATIRAESPADRMMVLVLEYDLNQALKEAGGEPLKKLKVGW